MNQLPNPDLRSRHRQPELMDDPSLVEAEHVRALRGLARINAWSGSGRVLWGALRAQFHDFHERTARVLDIASGGGDVLIDLWRRARRAGVTLDPTGWDISAQAVAYATQRATAAGVSIRFVQADALTTPIPADFDAIICSLFLHHLDSEPARALLQRMADATRRLVAVNDLARSYRGYWLAWLGTRLLSRSRIVHMDGPLSVQAAFTPEEARQLADGAGLRGARVERRWPCRFLLTWVRPQ